jgi:hypothetical protein
MCDNLEQTTADLRAKDAEFVGEISEGGFGRTVPMRVPGPRTYCSTSRATPRPTTCDGADRAGRVPAKQSTLTPR